MKSRSEVEQEAYLRGFHEGVESVKKYYEDKFKFEVDRFMNMTLSQLASKEAQCLREEDCKWAGYDSSKEMGQ